MVTYSFFVTEKIEQLLILKFPLLCFFRSSYCQQPLFLSTNNNLPLLVFQRPWYLFSIFFILVEGLSLLFKHYF